MKYVISVGTNIGNREENIKNAREAINNIPNTEILRVSSIYETEPVGYTEQDDFYNAVFEVESSFEPHEMLGICLGIEAALGRVRKIKNGPRIIDLDIIFAENLKIESENLLVPHPRYKERKFVLTPLLELFENGEYYGNIFLNYIEKIEGQNVIKIEKN